MIMEILTGLTTAAGSTLTNLTMQGSDSLQVRDLGPAYLIQAWVDSQAAGDLVIKSPNMHDNQNGIRLGHVASEVRPLLPMPFPHPLLKGDTLSVQQSGSGTAGDIDTAVLTLAYPFAGGGNGGSDYVTYEEFLRDFTGQILMPQNTITTGVAGAYASEAINAEFDNFKGAYYYCLLGASTDTECAVITYQGAATGNYRIGIPGHELDKFGVNYFLTLAQAYSVFTPKWAVIPRISGFDKGSFYVGCAIDENGADPKITTYLALMKKRNA